MSDNCNPIHLYTLDTLDTKKPNSTDDDRQINNFFWGMNPHLLKSLGVYLQKHGIQDKIIDIGCGSYPFPKADYLLDFTEVSSYMNKIVFKLDVDFERFLYVDAYFNFGHCRHVLEDIQNPQHAFNEIVRVCKSGYIETPSPLAELVPAIERSTLNYRGYIHHRYFVWSNLATNTLFFLPKYPIIERLNIDDDIRRQYYLLNQYPVYWNNYYMWSSHKLPKIVVYRHGINMEIGRDYLRLLNEGINSSIEYTNHFIGEMRGYV